VWNYKPLLKMRWWGAACLVCERFTVLDIPHRQIALRVLFEHARVCTGGFTTEDDYPGRWLEPELPGPSGYR
jgi:hypothetical protein